MRREDARRDLVKCEDMRLFADRAMRYMETRTADQFSADEILQAAIVRCVSVVGEAANRVSTATQDRFPEIPWSAIIGMRNVLVHDYVDIDPARIHFVVTVELPRLVEVLERVVVELEQDAGWED